MSVTVVKTGEVIPAHTDYSNHNHLCRDGDNNLFMLVTIVEDVYILKRRAGQDAWEIVCPINVGKEDKFGYGGIEVVGKHLVLTPSQRVGDATTPVQYKIYNVAVPPVTRAEFDALVMRVAALEESINAANG